MTSFVATGFPKFMFTVAKNRGNFDTASQEMAQTQLDRPVLLTTHKMATTLIADRKPLEGIKLAPTDLDWTFGDGEEITGSAEAIMMAMADRPSALSDISGPGADRWR